MVGERLRRHRSHQRVATRRRDPPGRSQRPSPRGLCDQLYTRAMARSTARYRPRWGPGGGEMDPLGRTVGRRRAASEAAACTTMTAVRPRRRNRASRRAVVVGLLVGGCSCRPAWPSACRGSLGVVGGRRPVPRATLADGPGATTLAGDGRPGFGGDGGPADQRIARLAERHRRGPFGGPLHRRHRQLPGAGGAGPQRRQPSGGTVRAGTIVTVAGGPCRDDGQPTPRRRWPPTRPATCSSTTRRPIGWPSWPRPRARCSAGR